MGSLPIKSIGQCLNGQKTGILNRMWIKKLEADGRGSLFDGQVDRAVRQVLGIG